MQIKVFKAGNMKDAMAAMKAELGEEAVILHSKKYKEGGLLGIGSREVVEITAAVEEKSLPKRNDTPRLKHPTVAPSSLLTRYKTSGTAQGVEEAERANENFSAEIDDEPQQSVKTDKLTEKISAQKSFEDTLKETQEDLIFIPGDEPQPVEEILKPKKKSQLVKEFSKPQKKSQLVKEIPKTEDKIQPVEEIPKTEDKIQPVEEIPKTEDKVQPVEEIPKTEDKIQPVEEIPKTEDKIQPVEEIPKTEDKIQPVEEIPKTEDKIQPVEEIPTSEENPKPVEEIPKPEDKPKVSKSVSLTNTQPQPEEVKSQQAASFTEEQMAQTQAMIMAQFNQMQMMQQAAIAQAQAQAAEQIRLQQVATVQPQVAVQSDEKIRRLEEEIAQMKALLTEILGRESSKGGVSLHEALKMQEVDEDILKAMAAQSNAGDTLVDMHTPAAKATLLDYLNEHVRFSDGVKLNRHGVRIVALLGTTGVGKTTTLAKIAAKFVLEQRTNVALITADTYRISAVEQLKTYSDILELPLEIVYNPNELAAAIERHRLKDLILIDTAGRSQHNEYQMRELEEFLKVNPRIEKHLVISATTKYTDAKQIMNKFSQVNPDKIIFTKIDETGSLGMIVNLLNDNRYSLSYITTGQSVPDDIERATSEILANLLLQKVEE